MPGLKFGCIGEAMLELSQVSAPGTAQIGIAGDVFNTAVYLRRAMGNEHQISFISAIGSDPISDQMAAFMDSEGVDTSRISRSGTLLPGIYAINIDATGERSFQYWRENSAARTMFQTPDGPDFSALEGLDVVYLSAITLAILPADMRRALFGWISQFRTSGGQFVFDSNYRPKLWTSVSEARDVIETAWRLTDIALPTIDDEQALFPGSETEILARLRGYGIPFGVLKRGELGPLPIHPIDTEIGPFPMAKNTVDTTAAGDSFNAGFLAAHFSGQPLNTAMLAGHHLAALVVGHKGAIFPRDVTDQARL